MGLIQRLATRAPVPVFLATAQGGARAADRLRTRPELDVVDTPRAASVLLVVGALRPRLLRPLAIVHDQLPPPRATVWWPLGPPDRRVRQACPWIEWVEGDDWGGAARGGRRRGQETRAGAESRAEPGRGRANGRGAEPEVDRAVEAAVRAYRELAAGDRDSDPALEPPTGRSEWRGVGPHGQGGKGMMMGEPYGRPMAMTAEDRDGLQLDRVAVDLGPFLPFLPPGLALRTHVQGDVLQAAHPEDLFAVARARPAHGGFAGAAGASAGSAAPAAGLAVGPPPLDGVFFDALHRPVRIAELERARAAHLLRAVALALRVQGLQALAERALRLAFDMGGALAPGSGPPDSPVEPPSATTGTAGGHRLSSESLLSRVRALRRTLERTLLFGWATKGVGRIAAADLPKDAGGPVARASGLARDERTSDESYRALGFEPVLQEAGDARARWRQRLLEAEQALELATAAGDRVTSARGRVESPRGLLTPTHRPSAPLLALLPALLEGQEWGDAMALIASLDPDPQEPAWPLATDPEASP